MPSDWKDKVVSANPGREKEKGRNVFDRKMLEELKGTRKSNSDTLGSTAILILR